MANRRIVLNSKNIEATVIPGNRTLAKLLGVHENTIGNWLSGGIIKPKWSTGTIHVYEMKSVIESLLSHGYELD